MKSKFGMSLAILLCVSIMAVVSSFAVDNEATENIMAPIQMQYSTLHDDTGHAYVEDKDRIITESLTLNNKKNDHNYKAGLEGAVSNPLYLNDRVVPYPMVDNTSFYLANDIKTSNTNPPAIDLGLPSTLGMTAIGAAFMTNLIFHEFGHAIVADHAGAKGNRLDFFNKDGDKFFLGTSSVEDIDDRSKLSYTLGGEFFADLTFEHALKEYRKKPTTYNRSLLIFSGTDFLWYSFYAFYLSEEHSSYDPITISKETGLSRDLLFSVVLAKTAMNAYRLYSGQDKIIPYFMVDKYSASLNVLIPFENLWIEKSKWFQASPNS